MKITFSILVFSCFHLSLWCQTTYFDHDTLDYVSDSNSVMHPRIGEVWYLVNNSSLDTLTFTKQFYSKSSVSRFEFEKSGQLYIEGSMLDCGEWASEFYASFAIDYRGKRIRILNPKKEDALNQLCGIFTISVYSNDRLQLLRKK